MSVYTTNRRIRLEALPFAASMRWDGTTAEVEADRPLAELQAAVDAAPTDMSNANREALHTKANDAIATLENATAAKATWDALTAAQRQEVTRVGLLAVAKIARLALGRLDAS